MAKKNISFLSDQSDFSDSGKSDYNSSLDSPVVDSRGVRNNNPFNIIKTGIDWIGEITGLFSGQDSKFETFATLNDGLRAGMINIKNGYLNGSFTPVSFVQRYAPSYDNSALSQANYSKWIASEVFGSPSFVNDRLTIDNLIDLSYAVLTFENGVSPVSKQYLMNLAYEKNILA